jgi:hypothetical protein
MEDISNIPTPAIRLNVDMKLMKQNQDMSIIIEDRRTPKTPTTAELRSEISIRGV